MVARQSCERGQFLYGQHVKQGGVVGRQVMLMKVVGRASFSQPTGRARRGGEEAQDVTLPLSPATVSGCVSMLGTTCCCNRLSWPLLPHSRATQEYHHPCLIPVHTAAGGPPEGGHTSDASLLPLLQ